MAKYSEDFNLRIGAQDKSAGAIRSVTKNIAGMAAGFMSVAVAARAFKSAFEAALEHQAAYNDLRAAVERLGVSWQDNEKALRAFTSQMQMMTAVSDEQVARSMQLLLDYGMGLTDAMKTMETAMDLAAARGIELKMAVDLLGKAYVGYTSMLSRYGIIVDQNLTQTEKFAAAIEKINTSMGGAAAEKMKAAVSQWGLFKELIGDLMEDLTGFTTGPGAGTLDFFNDYLFIITNTSNKLMEAKASVALFRAATLSNIGAGAEAIVTLKMMRAEIENVQKAEIEEAQIADLRKRLFELTYPHLKQYAEAIGPALATEESARQKILNALRQEVALKEQLIEFNKRLSTMPAAPRFEERPILFGPGGVTPGQEMAPFEIPEKAITTWDKFGADILESLEEPTKKMSETTLAFVDAFQSGLMVMGDAFTDLLLGMETDWGDTLRRMAKVFLSSLVSSFLMRAAQTIIMGPAGGAIPTGGMPMARMAGSANITININGDVMGTDEFVRSRLVPPIERAAREGYSRLALRGRP